MKVGTAQIDITAPVGVELSGYAARTQPSAGVLDRLHAKALYLEEEPRGGQRLLWLATDLLAVPRETVLEFRRWAFDTLGLVPEQVLVSATHTHSAPATVHLTSAGRPDPDYLRRLPALLQEATRAAVSRTERCELLVADAPCNLAVDRRHLRLTTTTEAPPAAVTDPHVLALGFRRPEGTFAGAVLNYAMHPVSLGHVNRQLSADWCGYAAEALAASLPGRPLTLVTNGAAGNLNPPGEGWPQEQVRDLGAQVASTVAPLLERRSEPACDHPALRCAATVVALPLDVLTPAQIDDVAAHEISKIGPDHVWYKPIRLAIDTWRRTMKERLAAGDGQTVDIELHAIRLGPVTLVAVNCEMFAHFTHALRAALDNPHVYTVGYSNGAFGYVAHSAAYDEGGYEVDSAHFFYNSFRPRRGGLEMLADRAVTLVRSMG